MTRHRKTSCLLKVMNEIEKRQKYVRTLLITDSRRCELKKYGRHGGRSRIKKGYGDLYMIMFIS